MSFDLALRVAGFILITVGVSIWPWRRKTCITLTVAGLVLATIVLAGCVSHTPYEAPDYSDLTAEELREDLREGKPECIDQRAYFQPPETECIHRAEAWRVRQAARREALRKLTPTEDR